MRWKKDHGEHEQWYQDLAQEGTILKAWENRPILFADLVHFWNAFCLLDRSRPVAFCGLAPIPVSEIEAYCRFYGIDDLDDRDDLMYYVQAIDDEYRSLQKKKDGGSKS